MPRYLSRITLLTVLIITKYNEGNFRKVSITNPEVLLWNGSQELQLSCQPTLLLLLATTPLAGFDLSDVSVSSPPLVSNAFPFVSDMELLSLWTSPFGDKECSSISFGNSEENRDHYHSIYGITYQTLNLWTPVMKTGHYFTNVFQNIAPTKQCAFYSKVKRQTIKALQTLKFNKMKSKSMA